MGVLSDDLTRLRNEVLALRSARQELMHDLEQETEDRRIDVSRMLADFSKDLGAGARKTRTDRLGSISSLRGTVTDLLTGVRTDLCGIRQAWLALGAASHEAAEELARRSRLGVGAGAEGSQSETSGKRPRVPGGAKPERKKRKH
jgi:hypothetical protein